MNSQRKKLLFDEFPSVSTKQWEDKIREDLKGDDYEKKLVWQTPEGFKINPYYRKEHLENKEYLNTLPGEFPFLRGNKTKSNSWDIRQDIYLDDIATANRKALFILDHGINSLGFNCSPEKEKFLLKKQKDFSHLLNDITLEGIGLNFICGFNAPQIVNMLQKETQIRKIGRENITGSTDFDPLGYLTITGRFNLNEKTDLESLVKLLKFASDKLPNYRVLGINGYFFTSSGASIIQELGYSLAMANDYLSYLTDIGLDVNTICRHLQFNMGVGSNYFMEIAKIRAARFLWAKIVEAYNPQNNESTRTYIHSVTSEWNQTFYDPYMNILRATTESMSAIIGGTDSLVVRPFTFPYKPTTKFSGRLARNIQIILNEEAYMSKVIDPAAGSYYIENLTDSIIDETWKIFLKVESEGGYLQALKKGLIQADIEVTAQNRENLIATRREILVGTNQYPDFQESVKSEIDEDIAFPSLSSQKKDVQPLKKFRGAMSFEKLRLSTEKHTHRPLVFMLTMGDLSMRRARATFAYNFFTCAGYEVIDNPGFLSVEEGVKAALNSKADIITLCSSDDEYPVLAPAVFNHLKDKAILVVAGAPACMDELRTKSIENFIHFRSNVLETLKLYNKKLGIEL